MIDALLSLLESSTALTDGHCQKIRERFEQEPSGLVETIMDTRLVSEEELLKAQAKIYQMPYTDALSLEGCREEWVPKISRAFLKRYGMVPLAVEGKPLVVVVSNPSDLSAADDVAAAIDDGPYTIVLAPRNQILSAVNNFYDRSGESAQQLVEDMEGDDFTILDDSEQTADLLDDTSDAPVIRLVNHMISQAVKAGASDIHIEPFHDELTVRYRIDGILYEMIKPPKGVQASLVSRIKVMAKMNIAEKRVPQDGRAQVKIGNQDIDIRISTVPTAYGERLVMRLLNKSGYFLAFSEFGMSQENFEAISDIIRQNNGIVLVTGPTGSGKTTTLYAALSDINSPDKNIITIEDPVEYNLKGVGQIQVDAKIGVTFAKGLRSIVRQDPDVILIGEIRDLETAEIAIQSALTGHLVFSTLHTNDAAGAITRLVDLGVEPYLISSSVNAVIAQRLVRVLCPHCKEQFVLEASHLKSLVKDAGEYIGRKVYRPKGCTKCFNTGYSGRQAIFEIMFMDSRLKTLVLETSDSNQIKSASLAAGMQTLRQDGLIKVLQGITSIGEVLRVTQE